MPISDDWIGDNRRWWIGIGDAQVPKPSDIAIAEIGNQQSTTPDADKKVGLNKFSKPNCIKFQVREFRFSSISFVFGILPKTHM